MKIWNYLKQDHIFLDAELPDKDSVFRFVASVCKNDGIVENSNILYEAILARENTMSTGIGNGIGLPHAVTWEAKEPTILLIRPACPMDFDALDSKPVCLILAMVIPGSRINMHLQLLAGISRLCKKNGFFELVKKAGDSKSLWNKIRDIEEKMAFH